MGVSQGFVVKSVAAKQKRNYLVHSTASKVNTVRDVMK